MLNAQRRQRINHRIHDRRQSAGTARLPTTLNAKGIGCRWCRVIIEDDFGYLIRPGHGVIHKRAGQ